MKLINLVSFIFFINLLLSCKKTDNIPDLPKENSLNLPLRIKFLQTKVQENPKNDFALYLLAKDYMKQEKLDDALLSIRKAILLKPNKKYLITLSECFYKKNQFLDAFDVLNQLDINDLSDMEFTSKAIEIFLKAQNFKKANELIDNKLAQDSLNADLLFKKSEINFIAKDTNAAIILCQKSIQIDSSFKPALDKLCAIYYENKNYLEAIRFATKSIKMDSMDIQIILINANALHSIGEIENSMTFFSKILLQDSSQNEVLSKVIEYDIFNKNYSEAYFLLKKLEMQDPNYKNLDYNLATTLLYTGRHQEALVYYSKIDSTSKYKKNAKYLINKIKQKLKKTEN